MRLLREPASEPFMVNASTDQATFQANRMLNILLAEDNDINALLVKAALSKAGHQIVHCRNGQEAIDLVTSADASVFDLILMDMHMPVVDGHNALKQIRDLELRQNRKPVPALILSADGQDHVRENVTSLGIAAYLLKPISPKELLELVDRVGTGIPTQ